MIESFRIPSEVAQGVVLPVVVHQDDPDRSAFALRRERPLGRFDLWVCDGCGHSELWATDLQGLRHDPAAGVHLFDSTPDAAKPFR